MGGTNSSTDKKGRAPRRDGQDLEYYKMVQERERRDQARYKEISNQKGTSLHNLKQRETLTKA